MSDNLKAGCQASIYAYAPQHAQNNAILFGENADFVKTVIKLYRDRYADLLSQGEETWTDDAKITAYLDSIKPE